MIDYTQIVEQVQRALAKRFSHTPDILNMPGRSLACKVDPYYYLALYRGCVVQLAKWSLVLPDKVEAALVKTGNLVTRESDREPSLALDVTWGDGRGRAAVKACFLDASFVDQALILYGGGQAPQPVSTLKIVLAHRPRVDEFLKGKTLVQGLAYG